MSKHLATAFVNALSFFPVHASPGCRSSLTVATLIAQVAREAALHEAELAEAKQQGAGHYRTLLQREGELSAQQRASSALAAAKVLKPLPARTAGMLRHSTG